MTRKIRKTKIICTIGPASKTPDMIEALAKAGMNICRLNFSHEEHSEHLERINMIRQVADTSGFNLGILLDTKGPEIRVDQIENGSMEVSANQIIKIVKETVVGNSERFSINPAQVFDDVSVGNRVLIDDGKIAMNIIAKDHDSITCQIENPGVIKTRKGVNVPNVKLSMPFISAKDDADIRFGCKHNVDYIAASFTRRAQDIQEIRQILIEEGQPRIQIIAKIENQEGYDNIREILEVADGVMVARGDLGVEVSMAHVPIYQKKIIAAANEFGKPVITATHMLESMMSNPRPTRAEANDVANAVLDGTDAIMLSGESAVGAYPIEAVTTMDTIARSMEEIIPYRERLDHAIKTSKRTVQDSIGISVADSALNLDEVEAIIAFTQGGSTARRISKFRPPVPIFAVTFTKENARRLLCNWGVVPVYSDIQNEMTNDDDLANTVAKTYGIEVGKQVIITAGYPTGEGTANLMKIIEVK
jgi:pyruvate kinase